MRFRGHKGDLIHQVENSLELTPHVSGHHVIKTFLAKVILGRETWGGPFKRHLTKLHNASSKMLVDSTHPFLCLSALLHTFI